MKPYRKPHISMNRRKYGLVKPIKKQKNEIRHEKPSTAELRSIYSRMKKCASWQIPDALAQAVQWYRRMTTYLYVNAEHQSKKTQVLIATRWKSLENLITRRELAVKTAQKAHTSFDKVKALTMALRLYELEVTKLDIKVPLLAGHLKKANKSAKKLDLRKHLVEKKFDPLLGMFIAASGLDVDLGAVPALSNSEGFKFDSTLHKMLYSRDALKRIKVRIREEGFLPVVLEQIVYIARSAAMKKQARKTGLYIVNNEDWVNAIALGLTNLCKWLAEAQEAPNRLIKRTVPKTKRVRKKKQIVAPSENVDAIATNLAEEAS